MLIICAFMYFSVDAIFLLIDGGWPFDASQWALAAVVAVMLAFSAYLGKKMIDDKKKKEEEEALVNGEAEPLQQEAMPELPEEEPETEDAGSKYDE